MKSNNVEDNPRKVLVNQGFRGLLVLFHSVAEALFSLFLGAFSSLFIIIIIKYPLKKGCINLFSTILARYIGSISAVLSVFTGIDKHVYVLYDISSSCCVQDIKTSAQII